MIENFFNILQTPHHRCTRDTLHQSGGQWFVFQFYYIFQKMKLEHENFASSLRRSTSEFIGKKMVKSNLI